MTDEAGRIASRRSAPSGPLRLLPGAVIVALQWLLWLVVPFLVSEATVYAVIGGLLGGVAIFVWWAFYSRAPGFERWSAILLMVVALAVGSRLVHESIGTGLVGLMYFYYAVPPLSLAFVIWAAASRGLSDRTRRATLVAVILVACGSWGLVRSEGITGEADALLVWRWTETHEEQLLARGADEPAGLPPDGADTRMRGEWPGFRGPWRDSIVRGVRIETNWSASPPSELWRRRIGPGCSSFAAGDGLLYTQEQRGEDEIVACYRLSTGEPVWRHRDPARFWDSHAGAGPRGTPTLSDGRIYTLGATGIINVLEAGSGAVVWSRNAAADVDAEHSGWGFTSSPLVLDDLVVVALAGQLLAYDRATGDPRWTGPDGGPGYSSPHLLTIDEIPQILLMSKVGATSVAPRDGSLLWQHPWPEERIVQPALAADGDLLLSAGAGRGMRRLGVMRGPDGWKIEERWTSRRLKPNFNDFVVHKGHAYGFNGPRLACIELAAGKRRWQEGRYGGQLILLADQDVLLVLTEKGGLALVEAVPDRFEELEHRPAIEGKTWNHPVLVGNILVVRNTQEMAAFRLTLAESPETAAPRPSS